jgi:hypothetical protein
VSPVGCLQPAQEHLDFGEGLHGLAEAHVVRQQRPAKDGTARLASWLRGT